jgi:hypothetical protein
MRPAVLATTLMLAAALAPASAASAADGPRHDATACRGVELTRGQQTAMAIEDEHWRLGAQGFSPLRNLPVREGRWWCRS